MLTRGTTIVPGQVGKQVFVFWGAVAGLYALPPWALVSGL